MIKRPNAGFYQRWISLLRGVTLAFVVVSLTGISAMWAGGYIAGEPAELRHLQQRIECGFNKYNLDDLRRISQLEHKWLAQQTWGGIGVRLTEVGLRGVVLTLLLISLHRLGRWLWFGESKPQGRVSRVTARG